MERVVDMDRRYNTNWVLLQSDRKQKNHRKNQKKERVQNDDIKQLGNSYASNK